MYDKLVQSRLINSTVSIKKFVTLRQFINLRHAPSSSFSAQSFILKEITLRYQVDTAQ